MARCPVNPLMDGGAAAAGWPFIHSSKWNSSACTFLRSPSTSIHKCWARGMLHSRKRFVNDNTLRLASAYIYDSSGWLTFSSIIQNQSTCPPFMCRVLPCHSSYIWLSLTRKIYFGNALWQQHSAVAQYRRSGNWIKYDRIFYFFLFKSLHKINETDRTVEFVVKFKFQRALANGFDPGMPPRFLTLLTASLKCLGWSGPLSPHCSMTSRAAIRINWK